MPEIVPVMTQALGNARQAVKDAAAAAMTGCMNTVNNKDLEQFIPMLIDTMQNPIKVPDCVHKLASTTFVQVREGDCVWQAGVGVSSDERDKEGERGTLGGERGRVTTRMVEGGVWCWGTRV